MVLWYSKVAAVITWVGTVLVLRYIKIAAAKATTRISGISSVSNTASLTSRETAAEVAFHQQTSRSQAAKITQDVSALDATRLARDYHTITPNMTLSPPHAHEHAQGPVARGARRRRLDACVKTG